MEFKNINNQRNEKLWRFLSKILFNYKKQTKNIFSPSWMILRTVKKFVTAALNHKLSFSGKQEAT